MSSKYDYFDEHFPPIYDESGDLLPDSEIYSMLDELTEEEDLVLLGSSANTSKLNLPLGPYGNSVPAGINITVPRLAQRTIAQGRDFYVIGTINLGVFIPQHAHLSVRLKDKEGKIVREVDCFAKDDMNNLYLDPSENKRISKFGITAPTAPEEIQKLYDEVKLSCVPDLVCSIDGHKPDVQTSSEYSRLDCLRFSWNKAYYTDTFFSALIYGGEYSEDERYIPNSSLLRDEDYAEMCQDYEDRYSTSWILHTDKHGKKIRVLEKGEYVLYVGLLDEDHGSVLAEKEVNITIGDLPVKILSPFSYPEHMKNLVEIDRKKSDKGTLLIDLFPGMWISHLFHGSGIKLRINDEKLPVFGYTTNKKRAIFNDGAEYRGGKIMFYDYGMLPISNALITEMPQMLLKLGSDNDISYSGYHYTYGEPDLGPYLDKKDGYLVHGKPSSLSENKHDQFVFFTRYEVANYASDSMSEGEYDPLVSRKVSIDDSPGRIINMPKNKKLAIVGVCNLIPNQRPSIKDPYGRFLDVDRITSLVYDIVGEKGSKYTVTKPIELVRYITTTKMDKDGNTISTVVKKPGCFEFRHVFSWSDIPELRNEKNITINCRGPIFLSSPETYTPPEGQVWQECCKVTFDS